MFSIDDFSKTLPLKHPQCANFSRRTYITGGIRPMNNPSNA
jgi:hypothetical protein